MKLPKKILLVDNDETSLYLNQRILNRLNTETEVLTATNGQHALDIMSKLCGQKTCPELILLDINMPIMTGFGFLKEFEDVAHQHNSSLKIVLLSSSTHPLDLEEAKKYLKIEYIEKPLTKEKLLKIL
jgi:CheY-like chemotaxis protein